eukprot:6655217-Prymnesium_polylepis.1
MMLLPRTRRRCLLLLRPTRRLWRRRVAEDVLAEELLPEFLLALGLLCTVGWAGEFLFARRLDADRLAGRHVPGGQLDGYRHAHRHGSRPHQPRLRRPQKASTGS